MTDEKHAVSGIPESERAPYGFETAAGGSVGSLWTLIGGLLVFAAILASVWWYLYPRLSGEPLSANAQLELRAAGFAPQEGWLTMTLPEGTTVSVAPDAVLTARDVVSFRGSYGDRGVAMLQLNLTEAGDTRLREYSAKHIGQQLAVLVNGRLLVCPFIRAELDGPLRLELGGISRSDAEEVFARLTQ